MNPLFTFLFFGCCCFPSFLLAPTEKRPKFYFQFCFMTLDMAFHCSLSSFPMYKVGIFIEAESEGNSRSTSSTLFQDESSFVHIISNGLFVRAAWAGNCSWKAVNSLETYVKLKPFWKICFFIARVFFLVFNLNPSCCALTSCSGPEEQSSIAVI